MGHDLPALQALIFSLHMSEASIRQLVARKKLPYQDGQMALDRIRRSSSCAELLSLIVSNLWELDSLEQPTSSSSTKVLLPNEQIDRMDLRSRFAAMVDLLKTSPQAKSHVLLQLVVDERLPIVMCDASRLTRALLNLMVNSLKFTSEGAVTLSITMLEKSESHVTVRFEVSDTGRGMTETQISCVTRAYVRSPADEEGGMGLGLAIVVQAVASLGSNLVITSPGLGYGSTCAFTLQMKTALDEEPSDKRVAEDEPPMRVLLADDVDLILDGARSIITDMGHKVVYTASDGEALLKTLVDHADEIDIAFVDIRMPKLFGDAAVAQYRSWEREHRTHAPPYGSMGRAGTPPRALSGRRWPVGSIAFWPSRSILRLTSTSADATRCRISLARYHSQTRRRRAAQAAETRRRPSLVSTKTRSNRASAATPLSWKEGGPGNRQLVLLLPRRPSTPRRANRAHGDGTRAQLEGGQAARGQGRRPHVQGAEASAGRNNRFPRHGYRPWLPCAGCH